MAVAAVEPTFAQKQLLQRWRMSTFWVLVFGYIGYYLCRGNLSAALPLLSKEFGYSNTDLGIILTISELAYALGKFINGPISDRIGGRTVFILGMVGAIFFNLLFTQFNSILAFTIVWSLCRYSLSMGWSGVVKMIGAWYEPERNGTIMGWVSMNFQLGGGLALLYCGMLVSFDVGWEGLFVIPALTLSAIALYSYLASKESPQHVVPNVKFGRGVRDSRTKVKVNPKSKGLFAIAGQLLKQNVFRHLLFFSFLTTLLRSIFVFWTAKFLADIGMGDSTAIFKSSIFPLLGIIGTVLIGWYTDRYARNGDRAQAMWVMLTGLVGCLLAIAYLVPYRMEFQNWIVMLIGACGFFLLGPYSMAAGALSLDIAGAEGGGSSAGFIDGVGYLGGAIAAWGAGFVSDRLGWSHVFYILAGISALTVYSTYRMSLAFRARAQQRDVLVGSLAS